MSHHEYRASQELEREGRPFYGLIMAAMRQADTDNVEKLRRVWPEVWAELRARYDAPGGFLEGETPRPADELAQGDACARVRARRVRRSWDGSDTCPTGDHAKGTCPGDHGK